MLKFLRACAFPFSILYGTILLLRNKLFDWHILPSVSYDIPVISVGNLAMGGTGKTPHTEYLIRLLSPGFKVAVLSRGYKRTSKGFINVEPDMTAAYVGDETLQIARKFNNIITAVCESRRKGIDLLLKNNNNIEVILLDDAYQHRYVKPGLSILLSDYSHLYIDDFVVPTGYLREFPQNANRADIICISKSPTVLSPIVAREINTKLKIKEYQHLTFSYIKHGKLLPLNTESENSGPDKIYAILLFAGIANTYPLEEHLKRICEELTVIKFKDHHSYSEKDIDKIINVFNNIYSVNKIIVTTEKDIQKLGSENHENFIKTYPIFYVPIETEIHKKYKQDFDNKILNYVRTNKTNR